MRGSGGQIDEQIDLLMGDFVEAVGRCGDRQEVDEALTQKGMRVLVDGRCGGEHSHFEERSLGAAEYEAHADDQHERQEECKE